MASSAIEQAFQRHPRPQGVPTKAALLERALRKEQRASTLNRGLRESPWKSLVRQGELTQGRHVWTICFDQSRLAMVKETTNFEAGEEEFARVTKLSDHPHVATIKQAFESDTSWFFQFEYARITLEEVLSVHTRLKEKHIQAIASSVCPSRSSLARVTKLLDLPRYKARLKLWHRTYRHLHRDHPDLQQWQTSALEFREERLVDRGAKLQH